MRKHSIMKKIISLISAAVICATASAPVMAAGWQKQYPWAKESVEYCLENNIISGDETGDLMLGAFFMKNYQDAIVEVWDGVIAKIKSAFGI